MLPTLTTKRLILREILPSDIDGMFELDADPEVHKYLGNKPVSNKAQSKAIIEAVRQQYVDNGVGRFAVVDKQTNEFLGWSGIKLETISTNNHDRYYDLGYRFLRKHWGKGYATESALASLDFAFNQLKLETVYGAAECAHKASNRILQKVGLHFVESFDYEGTACNWYRLDRAGYSI